LTRRTPLPTQCETKPQYAFAFACPFRMAKGLLAGQTRQTTPTFKNFPLDFGLRARLPTAPSCSRAELST
jgi:hypothetical protein